MNEFQIVGWLVTGIITLGSFVAIIIKFTQPINELRVVIQKLLDKIDNLTNDNAQQGKRIDEHDNHLNKLDSRVDNLETKVDMYHHNK